MATLIASVTVAGAVPVDPTAKIFEAGTDEPIVIPAVPAYADSYEAFETEVWECEAAREAARAPRPVVTIGAGDLDEPLMTFTLRNEVDTRTLPEIRTAAVSGIDPYEEHGRLIDYVLQVEMGE